MDIVNQLARFWSGEILKGSASIPLNDLNQSGLPEQLMTNLTSQAQLSLQEEIERVCANPIFTFEEGSDITFRDNLFNLFSQNITLSDKFLQENIEQVFRKFIEEWRTDPISFRKAEEEPEAFATQIFQRASIIVASTGSSRSFPADVLAIICEASGLKSLGDAAIIETELQTSAFTLEEFVLLTRRLLKLREKCSVGRSLISYEGSGRTISEVPIAGTEAASVNLSASDSPGSEAVSLDSDHSAPAAAPEFADVPKAVSRPDLNESGQVLYAALMTEDALAYFSEILFDKDTVAYQRLAYHIARQKKVSSATTLADNELFVREIPSQAEPAVKLIDLIQQNFQEAG